MTRSVDALEASMLVQQGDFPQSPAKNGGNDGGSSVSGAISFSDKHMFDCLGFSFLEGLPAGPVVLVLIFFR